MAETCEKSKTLFQIGASHASPQITLERAKVAVEFEPSAIQIILPDWLPVTNAEAIDFLQRVAEIADPVGIVLYNPPYAKRVLAPVDFAELKRAVLNLVGLKVMSGNAAWYGEAREYLSDLSIFVPGHRLASGIAEGASGAYSNVACLNPSGAQKWYELMLTDLESALEIEARLQKFFSLHITPLKTEENYSGAALDKLLAAIGGWADVGTKLRFPYKSVPFEKVQELRVIARDLIPELFS